VSLGIAQAIVGLFEGYAVLGILFAVIFLSRVSLTLTPKPPAHPSRFGS
jgi:hypothetical protein